MAISNGTGRHTLVLVDRFFCFCLYISFLAVKKRTERAPVLHRSDVRRPERGLRTPPQIGAHQPRASASRSGRQWKSGPLVGRALVRALHRRPPRTASSALLLVPPRPRRSSSSSLTAPQRARGASTQPVLVHSGAIRINGACNKTKAPFATKARRRQKRKRVPLLKPPTWD